MRRVVILAVVGATLVVLGCSDDDNEPPAGDLAIKEDQAISMDLTSQKDAPRDTIAPQQDGGTTDDGASTADATAGTHDCGWVMNCASACGVDLGCVAECTNQGCSEAQTRINKLMSCAMQSCLDLCSAGLDAQCQQCLAQNCSADLAACETQDCMR